MQFSTTATTKEKAKKITGDILKGVGLIVVLAGLIWVGVTGFRNADGVRGVVANAISGIQAIFTPGERIVLSVVDSQTVVGEPFVVSWEHRGKDSDGSYTFMYECQDSIHLSLKTQSADAGTIFCNTRIAIEDTDTALTLTALGTIDGIADVPVHVFFTKNDETNTHREGAITLMIQDERLDTATSTDVVTPTPSTAPTGTTAGPRTTQTIRIGTTPNLFGKADLTVNFISVGLVDKKTGKFEKKDELPREYPSGKRPAIQFEVKNEGTNITDDTWRFEVLLPTSPSYTYKSSNQSALFPGDRIVYIVGFDRVRNASEDDYRIEVDTRDDIDESNERNNDEEGTLEIDR